MSEITTSELHAAIEDKLCAYFGVTGQEATDEQVFQASAMVIREIMSRHLAVQDPNPPARQVHYLSMEFLLGRSLMKNAYNLGVGRQLAEALTEMGRSAADIFETEPDAGLGNGGLGRLAACYSDSMATLGIPAVGYSICYEHGLFRQEIRDGVQTEVADDWRIGAHSWLIPREEDTCEVRFGGHVEEEWDHTGTCRTHQTGYTSVYAVPRDMLIGGYGGRVNTLRLWEAKSPESLDMFLFSGGQYEKALAERTMAEVITKVLYPADDHPQGKELRLKQQYFFVSATAQDIVKKHRAAWGDVRSFPEHHVIQINDTHPTLIIPELMRIFMDEDGLGWDEAMEAVRGAVAYTNHTVMSEALEKWPQGLVQQLLPRIWDIIREINLRWSAELREKFGGDEGRVQRCLILEGGSVHMANLCQAVCFKINGVSRLHGEILKNDIFRDVCSLRPDRYTYVTNGIDHRRWLDQVNPGLAGLVRELIGEGWLTKPEELRRLRQYENDSAVLARLGEIKRANKASFAAWLARSQSLACPLDPGAVLNVQVKRLHEYKRQLLNAMLITSLQHRLHDDPNADFLPRTFVFAAKAAGGYVMAKRIIELLNSLSADVNGDPACRGKLQVFFAENYRVSMAEVLMPAAQVSEQISTAGKEASGTGNMKLMMNGAITIGTMDGANVEMHEHLGDDNIFIFGLRANQVEELRGHYNPQQYYDSDPVTRRVLDRFRNGFADGKGYADIVGSLLYNGDPYMLLADFADYRRAHDELYRLMADPAASARKSLVNIAESGFFAADRAIQEYAGEIWHI